MRKDFNKLLCERERIGSYKSYRSVRHNKKFDDEAPRESMKARYADGYNYKELNENLNPLWRFLDKNCGRKWDKVYSEIKSSFDARSAIGLHVYQHLYQSLAIKLVEKDGILYVNERYRGIKPLKNSWVKWYVHPKTGLLLKNKQIATSKIREERLKRGAAEKAKTFRQLEKGLVAIRKDEDSPWFIGVAEQPKKGYELVTVGSGDKKRTFRRSYSLQDMFYRRDVVYPDYAVVSYKSASKKEIKKWDLR